METEKRILSVLTASILLTILFISYALGFVRIEGIWFIFPIITMRISTAVSAILCFSLVLYLQHGRTLKSIYYAFLAVIFSMGLYEFVWYQTAVATNGFELKIFEFTALLGWILLGVKEVYHVHPPKISIILYGLYLTSMILWITTGFQFNSPGTSSFSYWGESLNIISKTSIDFAYALHIGNK